MQSENQTDIQVKSMSVCEKCPIEEKIHVCCARYPRTGEQVKMILDDGSVKDVCPHLGRDGGCMIYFTRPYGCRQFFCERFFKDEGIRLIEENEGYRYLESILDN